MRFQNRFQRFMNHRAPANGRYKPTCYEHAANCYTHAFLIVPAIVGSALPHPGTSTCRDVAKTTTKKAKCTNPKPKQKKLQVD